MVLWAVKPIEKLWILFFELFEVLEVEVDGPFLLTSRLHVLWVVSKEFVVLGADLDLSQGHLVLKFRLLRLRQPLASLEQILVHHRARIRHLRFRQATSARLSLSAVALLVLIDFK